MAKSCYECGHKEVCKHSSFINHLVSSFINEHSEMSDKIFQEAIASAYTCFGSICIDWIPEPRNEPASLKD